MCFGGLRSFHGGLGEEWQIIEIKNNLVKCWGGVISCDANSAKQCGSKISRCGRHIGKRGGVKMQSEMKERN